MSAGHTEAPWEIVEYNDGESLAIHAPNSDWRICFMATPGSSPNAMNRIKANAHLIVAACNSYDRHYGPRAIEAAEADLLGRCLEALRIFAAVADEFDDSESDTTDVWIDAGLSRTVRVPTELRHYRSARAILSQVREVWG